MENYGYSYPDSGGSSPRSREVDFENPPPSWEEQSLPGNCKVKFLVSYGGKIHPRSHDNQLAYVGGETKILAVERNTKFSQFLARLSGICDGGDNIAFKYQLPGEELDALISVTNDDDLEHMMHEYDRLYRGSAKPARLRLFIFPVNRSGFGSGTSETRSERERFVHDAVNSGPVQGVMDSSAVAPPPPPPHQPRPVAAANNVDFLLGLEKGVGAGVVPPPPPQAVKVRDPVPDPEIRVLDERFSRSVPQIDARIQEMNRLQIAEQQRQQVHHRQRGEDNIVGGYAGDGYVQRLPEKLPPATIPASIPSSVPAQSNYWQPEKNVSGGAGFPATMGHHHEQQQQQQYQPHQPQQQQQVYMISAPAAAAGGGMYHAPIVRPVNGQAGPGYYQVAQPQRISSDVYREQQQVYNMVPPPMSSPPPPTVPVSLPPKMGVPYGEGLGMPVNSVGVTDAGYTQVMYDSATGRQMYHFTAAAPGGGGVVTPSYQGVPAAAAAAVNADARAVASGLTAEGKTAPKVLPTSAHTSLRSQNELTNNPKQAASLQQIQKKENKGFPTMLTQKSGTRPPWVGLGAAVWVLIASGNAYNFPLYSHSLKSVLGINQRQLTMLGVACDIGENVGLLPGLICNKFPPWIVLSIGGFACFTGYGVIWSAVSRTVGGLPYWLLWVALCVATNSGAWLCTAVLVTNMRNFPLNRGTVAGILKGYGGISAAVYTEIYILLLHKSSSTLLLFLALGVPTTCFLVMYLVRPCTPSCRENSSESSHLVFIQVASVLLGIYLLSTTVVDHVYSLSTSVSYAILIVMVLFLMAPLAIPIKMTLCPTKTCYGSVEGGGSKSDNTEPLLSPSPSSTTNIGSFYENEDSSDVDLLLAEGEGAVRRKKKRPKRGEDFKFMEAIVKADFWLLFLVYFVGVGSGVTVLNNLAQIGIAQGIDDATILLSTFSFFNFVGRLGGGSVSEYFVRWKTLPRTIWLTFTQVIMIITYLLFASAIDGTLYAATAMLGLCYGTQFSIMIPTASELFGLKHFGIIYNFMSLGNPLGAFLFSGLLAGYLYDNEVAKQYSGGLNVVLDSGHACLGPNCFRITFLVLAGVCCIGSILSIILTVRIKPVYQMLYAGGSFRKPQMVIK